MDKPFATGHGAGLPARRALMGTRGGFWWKPAWPVFWLLTSCTTATAPISLPESFHATRPAGLLQSGVNVIAGHILLRQPQGGTAACSSGRVTLFPASGLANDWVNAFLGLDRREWGVGDSVFKPLNEPFMVQDSDAFHQSAKTAWCDTDNRFEFRNVADGDFFVLVNVLWRNWGYPSQTGSLVMKASVKSGRILNLKWPPGIDPFA